MFDLYTAARGTILAPVQSQFRQHWWWAACVACVLVSFVFGRTLVPLWQVRSSDDLASCAGVVVHSEIHQRGADLAGRARVLVEYCRDRPDVGPLIVETNGRDGLTPADMSPEVVLQVFPLEAEVVVHYARARPERAALTPTPRYGSHLVALIVSLLLGCACATMAWRSGRQ